MTTHCNDWARNKAELALLLGKRSTGICGTPQRTNVHFNHPLSPRTGQHDVYLWPSLADHEKAVIREAFHQIHRRTCIRFNELDYKVESGHIGLDVHG